MNAFVTLLEHTHVQCAFGRLEYRWADRDAVHFEHLDEDRRPLTLTQQDFVSLMRDPRTRILSSRPSPRRNRDTVNLTFASLTEDARERALERCRYVQAYEAHVADGLKRTDTAIQHAMPSIVASAQNMNMRAKGQRKQRAGRKLITRMPPCSRALREWHAIFVGSGRDPRSLIFQTMRPSARKIYKPEVESVITCMINAYLTLKRRSVRSVIGAATTDLMELNADREARALPAFEIPSESTLRRRITDLEPFTVHARRYGLDAARRKFSIFQSGLPEFRPGHRIEIDEWTIDVYSWFAQSGLLAALSLEQRAKIPRGRRHLFVAIDCATRVVLGLKFASTPSSAASVALLEQICSEKADISAACDCENVWNQFTGVGEISTDQGPPFACDAFRQAAVELGWNVGTPPAAMPQLRATIERLFRTFGQELMPFLVGQIFGLRAEKSDYASENMVALSDDDLERIFVKFVVDIYHQKPHEGLMTSPARAWAEETGFHGILSAPDALSFWWTEGWPRRGPDLSTTRRRATFPKGKPSPPGEKFVVLPRCALARRC